MGNYDSIGIPVQGQPISSSQYGIRVRDAVVDLDRRVSLLEASQILPDNVSAASSTSGISISWTLGTWQDLPSGVNASITNPSADFELVVNVYFGCWIAAGTQGRLGLRLSGGITLATPNVGVANQPAGWGLFPVTTQASDDQHMGFMQVVIPPGVAAVTFTAMGYRSAASAVTMSFPTIHLVPDRYQLP
jgi:hypothetical protein